MAHTAEDWRPPGPRDWKCEYSPDGSAVHIRPRNDLTWHSLDDDCPCGPTSTHLPLDADACCQWLVIHHALDGRHALTGHTIAPRQGPTDGDGGDAMAVL